MSGAEALARWPDPIPPGDVPALLEAEGLTARFVERLLVALCDEQHELERAGVEVDLWMPIPYAALADVALAGRLAELVRANGADPRRIVWALGARALRPDAPAALHVLTRLRVMGFGLCLDDFGTGHPTLEQLERIPLTGVRLARHLVSGARDDPARVALLQDAIDAAHGLGLPVVGDGCETAADFELLLEIGCGHGQGAFIGEPVAAGGLAGWARNWSPAVEEER